MPLDKAALCWNQNLCLLSRARVIRVPWHRADRYKNKMTGTNRPSRVKLSARPYCAGAGAACCVGGLKFTFGACREPSSALKYASLRVKPDKLATMLLGNSPM